MIPLGRVLLLALACCAGCRKELQTVYGQRSGPGATESVNGTAVFAEMFEAAGHRVSSWSSLSPRLDQADCVVWFPDDFQPPSPDVVNWFERWLRAKPQRTLIYVGRDFDAAPWYWRKIEPTAPAGQQEAIADLRAEAEQCLSVGPAARTAHGDMPLVHGPLWRRRPARRATSPAILEWLQNIDPSQLEVELNSRMSPRLDMEALLESDEGLIVGRLDIGQSQLLVVANGSFLLNATLVNHEHRKLAGKLVDAIGPGGRDVVFLESGQIKLDQPASPDPRRLPPNPFGPSPDDDSARRDASSRTPTTDRPSAAPILRRTRPTAWNCSWFGRPIGSSCTLP